MRRALVVTITVGLWAAAGPAAAGVNAGGYWASERCAGCHTRIARQHSESHHERSFTNPVFQAQYFGEVLPRARKDKAVLEEARRCTACHAPVMFLAQRQELSSPALLDPSMSGVTCDVCHTISAIDGDEPRNGNYVSRPTPQKLGPFPVGSSWHRQYSELQTRSELCATCHEATNLHGVLVKATYTEWKASEFAKRDVQCQDCHMTQDGFLVRGESRHESGKSASVSNIQTEVRDRLYTHRFPGAHSRSQVEGALALSFARLPYAVLPGRVLAFEVVVDNARSGHKMPTGSADLRLLWLEVSLSGRGGALRVEIPPSADVTGYAIAGGGADDGRILGRDVPAKSRVYRAVYFDPEGRQTLSSWNAKRIAFDNRLGAGERRFERYAVEFPQTEPAGGRIAVEARLMYRSLPSAFTSWLELPPSEAVEVARATAELPVR